MLIRSSADPAQGHGDNDPSSPEQTTTPEKPEEANPGDPPGFPVPGPRTPVDPSEDPKIPVHDFPRGV